MLASSHAARRSRVLEGPNLNRLGVRKPEVYGTMTLADIVADLDMLAAEIGVQLAHFQSNHEGAMIDGLQSLDGEIDGVVCNPAGLGLVGAGAGWRGYRHALQALLPKIGTA